jgi:lysozyme family protein
MADISKLAPIVAKWEGGYVNDPNDRGGATNMGVTIGTWRAVGYDKDGDGDIDAQDIKLLNKTDFQAVLKKYWDRWQADKINNQSIANILVDWVWGSGKWGIVIPQRILGLKQDGVVGPKTLGAVNDADPDSLFNIIFAARIKFLNDIVANNPSQKKFIKGWLNRMADFKFSAS